MFVSNSSDQVFTRFFGTSIPPALFLAVGRGPAHHRGGIWVLGAHLLLSTLGFAALTTAITHFVAYAVRIPRLAPFESVADHGCPLCDANKKYKTRQRFHRRRNRSATRDPKSLP